MPVSNSFRCVCKFVDRAAMHHKVNYIAPEGMSNGRQAIFDSSCLIFPSFIREVSTASYSLTASETNPLSDM